MARQFVATRDVLMLVGDFLSEERETLHNLCLTSKTFYTAFSRHLYRSVWLREATSFSRDNRKLLDGLFESRIFSNTHTFQVTCDKGQRFWKLERDDFQVQIRKLIGQMNNLRTAHIYEFLLADSWILRLEQMKRLKHLNISFSGFRHRPLHLPNPEHPHFDASDLFPALKTAIFTDIWLEDNKKCIEFIVTFLLHTRKLEQLALAGDGEGHGFNFEELCQQYKQSQGKRLKLKGLFIADSYNVAFENIIDEFTNIQKIEQLRLPDAWYWLDDGSPVTSLVLPDAEMKTNLRQLSIDCLYAPMTDDIPIVLHGRDRVGIRLVTAIPPLLDTSSAIRGLAAEATTSSTFNLELGGVTAEGLRPTLCDLRACTWITHLKIDLEMNCGRWMPTRSLQMFVLQLRPTLAKLSKLVAFSFDGTRPQDWEDAYNVEKIQSVAANLALDCPRLEYAEIFHRAYSIQRRLAEGKVALQWLSDRERERLRREHF